MIKPNLEDIKGTLGKTEFPVTVIAEAISYCNLDCIMCPQPNLKRERGEMSLELFQKIVDEIANENPNVDLWLAIMGEPLILKEKFIDMVKYAKKQGVNKVHLNTNGCLMTNEIADKLIESQVDEIIFGIDATTKDTYEKIRVNGKFHDLISNIEYLIKRKKELNVEKPKMIMQFIVMDENENEMEEFKRYWLEKGQIVKIRPKLGWGNGVKAENLTLNNEDREFPCPWLIRTMSIHWNGNVAQCDADYDGVYSAGNINYQSMKEIWNGELEKRRDKHWNMDFDFKPCSDCKDWQAGRSYFYYPEGAEK